MRRDSRISYYRQPENIGPPRNFLFVLRKATSPYFMWAAHDDWWDPEFVAENLHALQTLPEAVCSVSIVEVVGGEGGLEEGEDGGDARAGGDGQCQAAGRGGAEALDQILGDVIAEQRAAAR